MRFSFDSDADTDPDPEKSGHISVCILVCERVHIPWNFGGMSGGLNFGMGHLDLKNASMTLMFCSTSRIGYRGYVGSSTSSRAAMRAAGQSR